MFQLDCSSGERGKRDNGCTQHFDFSPAGVKGLKKHSKDSWPQQTHKLTAAGSFERKQIQELINKKNKQKNTAASLHTTHRFFHYVI